MVPFSVGRVSYNTPGLKAVTKHSTGIQFEFTEAQRVEKALAIARVILAVASGLAIWIDPTEPSRYYVFTYTVLGGYTLFSFILVLFPRFGYSHHASPVLIQAIDIVWVSVLIVGTGGTTSPFFVFYTFTLVSGAYRWGFWESVCNGLLVALTFFALFLGTQEFQSFEVRFVIRAAYLILMSVVLGYLAENEKRLRAENALIAAAMSKAKAEFGLTQSMQRALNEIRAFYQAEAVIFVAEEMASGNIYVLGCTDGESEGEFGRFVELEAHQRLLYFFPVDGESWHSIVKRTGMHDARLVDGAGKPTPERNITYPQEFVNLHFFQSLLAAKIAFGQELAGRLFILDPHLKLDRVQELAFIQRVVRLVIPTLYNVYLWRRLKARTGAIERARIARDLHDGVIQSLIGLEMQLDVMKHRTEGGQPPSAGEVERVQQLLRTEIKGVRILMNELRQPKIESSELINIMSEQVDKFSRETGISAKFVAETEQVPLPPEVCREMVQILQEALVNVRKHSGAKHLLVRFSAPEDDWNLAIIDDGRGFDFEGRLSHAQLDERKIGPFVIKERVRLIHGELEVESVPGHGARLDIRLPKRIYA
jgi:signal transduction histidine kinase